MATTKTFTREDVERVRAALKTAPEKPKPPRPLTMRETVVAMSAEIRDLQKRGYTLDDVAAMIRDGFNLDTLGASTLKNYLAKKRPRGTRRASSAAQS